MKKNILVCALISTCMASFAQTNSTHIKTDSDKDKKYHNDQKKNTDKEYQNTDKKNKACAMTMTSGKMMMVVDGKTVVMDKEMTMKNGTIVMMDGTVKTKGGQTMKMKESDCIDMSGKMIVVKNSQVKSDPQMEQ